MPSYPGYQDKKLEAPRISNSLILNTGPTPSWLTSVPHSGSHVG